MGARYDRDTVEGHAELARHVLRRTPTSIDERYGLLAVVVWGDQSHDVALRVLQLEHEELVEIMYPDGSSLRPGTRDERRRRDADIRSRVAAGEPHRRIADDYGLARSRVSQIASDA